MELSSTSKLLTPRQASQVLNCSVDTVRRLCANGSLRSVNIGTGTRDVWRVYADAICSPKGKVRESRLESFCATPLLDRYSRRRK